MPKFNQSHENSSTLIDQLGIVDEQDQQDQSDAPSQKSSIDEGSAANSVHESSASEGSKQDDEQEMSPDELEMMIRISSLMKQAQIETRIANLEMNVDKATGYIKDLVTVVTGQQEQIKQLEQKVNNTTTHINNLTFVGIVLITAVVGFSGEALVRDTGATGAMRALGYLASALTTAGVGYTIDKLILGTNSPLNNLYKMMKGDTTPANNNAPENLNVSSQRQGL